VRVAEPNETLTSALAYASRGWPVLPLHSPLDDQCSCGKQNCKNIGKHPRLPNGLNGASTDANTIRSWWLRWPTANVGIITGKESGFVVLDNDSRSGGDAALGTMEAMNGPLSRTVESATGGGRHMLFRHPGQPIRNKVGIKVRGLKRSGLDLRGDGGYIVAPPSLHANGKRYCWVVSPDELEPQEMPAWLLAIATQGASGRGRSSHADADAEPISEGARNDTLFRMACEWRASGDDEGMILVRLRGVPCTPRLDDQELQRIARSAAGHRKGYRPSDVGNARRLVHRHGKDLRYCRALKTWLLWDGKRWKRDVTGEVDRRAKDTIIALYADATREPDTAARSALIRHALHSEAEPRIRAMVALAATDVAVAVSQDQLDSDPWLLNVETGTLDLRTGALLPHNREHLITRIAPVDYAPGASCPIWENFLNQMVPDAELRGFLQRAVGLTLTGDTGEEVLLFVHGPTNAGKSTFTEAVKATLGDYATTADFEAFLRRKEPGIRNDIARMAGARMVLSLEVDEGRQLAVSVIKSLTGGDTVTARFLHKEFFEFRPTFKLWLVANHKPTASAADAALWRRIRVIPFTRSLAESDRDPNVKKTLRDSTRSRSAILAWAVQGCLAWQKDGLGSPPAVRRATESYRKECDALERFLSERCVLRPDARVGADDLYSEYKSWCEEQDETPLAQQAFGKELTKREIGRKRGTGGRGVRMGIALSDRSDQSDLQFGKSSLEAPLREKTSANGSLASLRSLDENAKEAAEERAAILEFEAGLDPAELERIAEDA
jgi:putative DNA primase/helicase